jgi:eukaryotic-like serine/threonine-protein kinase
MSAISDEGLAASEHDVELEAVAIGSRLGEHLEIESRLGDGRGGEVLLARDVRLDRRVAVKLYRAGMQPAAIAAREREVRMSARLSHPNVAAIHEVGRLGDRLFVASERVDGGSVRAWLAIAPRSWREIVALWLQAGQGLVAAHLAGFVHGDFGADQLLLGRERVLRVRVTDFSGHPADRAGRLADRQAWCRTLVDALHGQPVVPTWLQRVLAGGITDEPTPELDAMIAMIERRVDGRARRWLAVALVTAVVAGIGGAALGSRELPVSCDDGSERIAAIWSSERRDALRPGFVAAGDRGEQAWQHASESIDAWTARWIELRASSCHATRDEGTQDEAVLELSMGCFDRRAAELDALLDAFAEQDPATLARAPEAASALPSAVACGDEGYLLARTATPPDAATSALVDDVRAQIRRVAALRRANRIPAAIEATVGLREQAEATGYETVHAEALLELARVASMGGHDDDGRELLHEALLAARRAGDAGLLAEAASKLANEYARAGDGAQAQTWLDLAQLEIDRGVTDPEVSIDSERTRAFLLSRSGDLPAAREHYQLALEQTIAVHGDNWRAAAVRNDVAILLATADHPREAEPIFAEVIAAIEREIGANTPQAANARGNHGQLLNELDRPLEGEQELRRSIAVLGVLNGEDSPALFSPTLQLGLSLVAQERYVEARDALERAAVMGEQRGGPDSPEIAVALDGLALCNFLTGDPARAYEQSQRSAGILAARMGEDSRDVLSPRSLAALSLMELGRFDEARELLGKLVADCERTACPSSILSQVWMGLAAVQLRDDDVELARDSAIRGLEVVSRGGAHTDTVGHLRCTLAEALSRSGGDPVHIRELAHSGAAGIHPGFPEESARCARLGL